MLHKIFLAMQQDTASTTLWKSKSKPRQATVTYTSMQTSKQEACGKLSSTDLASVHLYYRKVCIQPLYCIADLIGTVSLAYVQAGIMRFEERFNYLKKGAINSLETWHISVARVAEFFTSLPADKTNQYLQYLSDVLDDLDQSRDHSEVFRAIKYHWNYLWYYLLDLLIGRLNLKEVKWEMEVYKKDMQLFQKCVPLTLFCLTEERRRRRPPEYSEIEAEFEWPDDVQLDRVEEFRLDYLHHYQLYDYVMMLAFVKLSHIFTVSWFIPDLVVKNLKVTMPEELIKKYSTVKLTIAGELIYSKPRQHVRVRIYMTCESTYMHCYFLVYRMRHLLLVVYRLEYQLQLKGTLAICMHTTPKAKYIHFTKLVSRGCMCNTIIADTAT